MTDIVLSSARVLYHELAHANDLIRPQNFVRFDPQLTPLQALDLFPDQRVAEVLYADESLSVQSSILYSLARARYDDEPLSEFEKSVLADFAGSVMGSEGKQTFYGYYTIWEDVATLFAQTMMSYHFGLQTHVGFMNKPDSHPDANCNDYKVAWGVRNRLASSLVAPRARLVTELLIGQSAELDRFFTESLGEQTPLREGDGWCESRFLVPDQNSARSRNSVNDNKQFNYEKRLYSNHGY